LGQSVCSVKAFSKPNSVGGLFRPKVNHRRTVHIHERGARRRPERHAALQLAAPLVALPHHFHHAPPTTLLLRGAAGEMAHSQVPALEQNRGGRDKNRLVHVSNLVVLVQHNRKAPLKSGHAAQPDHGVQPLMLAVFGPEQLWVGLDHPFEKL
jgi:hypothetical protein